MPTYYYDFGAATNGTGTSASPFNAWAPALIVPNDVVLFRRNTALRTAFTTVANVSYGTWYNNNGSDDTTQLRPIVTTTTAFSSFSSTNKDFVSITSWDIRAPSLTVASDKAVIFLGSGGTVNDCIIDTNVGAISSYNNSNITITNNSIRAVSHSPGFANNCVIVSGTVSMTNVTISNNTIRHYGGGSANCFGLRAETTLATSALTNLTIYNNTIGPIAQSQRMLPGYGFINESRQDVFQLPGYGFINEGGYAAAVPGSIYTINHQAIGMRLQRCPGAEISYNTINGMFEGIFMVGGGVPTACHFHHNTLTYNLHFGLHLTTDAVGCLIEYNTCSYNGTSTMDGTLLAYGRGIEMSSAAGQARCSNHTIRFNTCNNNYNYGGPLDNASEGVGIGLDDSVSGCLVYGNRLVGNEGNGIQLYGGVMGSGTPVITDTGGHSIVANFFNNNCAAAFKDRRSGGTFLTGFSAHIGCGGTTGTTTILANNVFVGSTPVGIGQNSTSTNITVANNIFIATPHALNFGNTPASVYNNDFFGCAQLYSSVALDGNGQPTYPTLSFSGVNDYTFDPHLDSIYAPQDANSLAVGSGHFVGTFFDYTGQSFKIPPSVGMYEFFGELIPPTGGPPPPPPPPPPDPGPVPGPGPTPQERSTRTTGGGSGQMDNGYYALPDEFWETRAEMLSRTEKPVRAAYPRRRKRRLAKQNALS